MKMTLRMTGIALLMLVACAMQGQAPAGSTGQCKDGTYTTAASKMGACRGHQGVKTWFAAPIAIAPGAASAKPPAAVTPTATAAAAAPASPATTSAPGSKQPTTAAAGGEPGMVWLNAASNVYHCPGTKYYGKTKTGSYMTEAAAKAKGARADHNHPCSK